MAATAATTAAEDSNYGVSTPLLGNHFDGIPGFYHGVASGDPLPNAVILWTRYTPTTATETVELELRVAQVKVDFPKDDSPVDMNDLLDPNKNSNLRVVESITVDGTTDFTAKIDLTGLEPGASYVYAFLGPDSRGGIGRATSQVGQTKTAPSESTDVKSGAEEEESSLMYAIFSCATYTQGYFHGYDIASTIADIDFYVHVGDYIYEHAKSSEYASDSVEREEMLRPEWETVTLEDYRQRYAVYGEDEAVQNLRRRAPLIAVWDDHELGDNAYGKGSNPSNSGAGNHQETCPIDRKTATDEEKDAAHCEFDEGGIVDRFNGAARAYMEWMPVRAGTGPMGVVDAEIGSLTRVLEWGSLATFIAFDSRISQRSKEPTLANVFSEFSDVAARYTNASEYTIPGSPAKDEIDRVAADVKSKMYDPQFTMVGEDIVTLIKETFAASKQKDKPWQMMLSPTLMGPNVAPNPLTISLFAPPAEQAETQRNIDFFLSLPSTGHFFRIVTAMAVTMTPWNRDDFNGFANERAQILDIFKEHANNAIVLSGDLHDSWVWQLYDGGNHTGKPVAVNLGGPGVSAPGFGRSLVSAFRGVDEAISLVEDLELVNDALDLVDEALELLELVDEGLADLVEEGWEADVPPSDQTQPADASISFDEVVKGFESQNPGLKHAELKHEGFIAVKVTAKEHMAEFIHVSEGNALKTYSSARAANGGKLTAQHFCSGKFTTQADAPGSLFADSVCDAIVFETARPAEWSIPVVDATGDYDETLTSGVSTSGQSSIYPSFFMVVSFWFFLRRGM